MNTEPAFVLTRDVTPAECRWLDRTYAAGETVFEYWGCTYGCVTPTGGAFTTEPGKTPFVELPLDAVKELRQLFAYALKAEK